MNRQLGAKSSEEGSGASPLSLLVHAADSQRSSGKNAAGKPDSHASSQRDEPTGRIPEGAPSSALEDHMTQRQAAARAEALHHQGLLSQLRGGALGGGGEDIFQQNAAIVAAQQQQQAAALALASDIRTAVAAAQLRQAAQLQNQDFLLARTAALQQLGLGGGGGAGGAGMEHLHQELELHRLEEYERRQLLAAAASGAPIGALAARQQLELQEAQIRQEQLDRQLSQGNDSMLDRAGLRAPSDGAGGRSASAEGGSKDSFQKTPGSVVVPCRARGMPMDHNFKTAYFVIPENVEHGEELICSYFACRNAGIKFRYCTHCKVPVAKRNFRKRHKHGKPNTNDIDEDASVEEEDDVIAKAKKDAAQSEQKKEEAYCQEIPKKMEQQMPPKAAEEPRANRDANVNKEVVAAPPKKNKVSKESRLVSDDNDAPSLPKISHQSRPKIGADRERLWAQLLAKRPPTKDGEAVSAWLMEVLSVSDLDTPLKENGQAQPAAAISLPFKTAGAPTDAAQLAAASFKNNKNNANKASSNGSAAGSGSNNGKDDASSASSSASSNVIIKKKRPLAVLQKDDEKEGSPTAAGAAASPSKSKKDVGSFAEWKDRKKHKGLPKKGFSMQQSE